MMATALLTTLMVVAWRSRDLAWATRSAAVAGSSAAGAAARVSLKGLALDASLAKELTAVKKATLSTIATIVFIDVLLDSQT